MTTTQTHTLAEQIERCFRTFDFEALRELYHPDVVLDATVPQWRFQLQGPDRILAWYRDAYSQFGDVRCTWLRTTAGGDLILVEWELRTGEGSDERLVREADALRLRDGRIVEQAHYCPGIWDAQTIARQKAEAPMVRSDTPR